MDKALLEYLINLFALLANLFPNLIPENVKDFLKSFLLKEFSDDIANENLANFNLYYTKYAEIKAAPEGADQLTLLLQNFVQQTSINLSKTQNFQIIIRLLLFEKILLKYVPETAGKNVTFPDIMKLCANSFHINEDEYLSTKGFINDSLYTIPDKKLLAIVGGKKSFSLDITYVQRNNLNGQLFFLYIRSVNILLFYFKGNSPLVFNEHPIFPEQIYLFKKGASIKGPNIEPVYYNQILRKFLSTNSASLFVEIKDVGYKFKNSNNGIHQLNLRFEPGQLIGIIGRTGVGKSTLINILNGSIKPQTGTIKYNSHDLWADSRKLDGLIGYVPQDDLLIEDLSVFTNLYLNAELCFGKMPATIITEKVNNVLVNFDLYDVKNLKVGTPLNKFISGGQRKKLNIALELIREPAVLYADEPTSGLSSSDTEEIMHLLAEQTITGKIVVINIHQPSSEIFKLFDKIIVLDRGGYPVYFGNPLDAIPYFNTYTKKLCTTVDYCNVCENINPESIFKALEAKKVNEFGESSNERESSPIEWHARYLDSCPKMPGLVKDPLPQVEFNKPGAIMQFIVFSKRNILAKIANHQYLFMALLISPLLATILAFLCRSSNKTNAVRYIFGFNDNIPSFLFMGVIVSLFVGLIISAEEIFKDKKILLRESYLRLSKTSYINSKVVYLIGLSALQTLLYVIISNSILDIHNMTFIFWLILFSTSCFGNLAGLLISSLFDSLVAIYIMVPIIIIPQILLSGTVVGFDKLNEKVSSKEFVPFVGDLMASRWAYEALITSQFKYNNYQEYFFTEERVESNDKFNYLVLIPDIKKAIYNAENHIKPTVYSNNGQFIRNGILALNEIMPFEGINQLNSDASVIRDAERIEKYLDILGAALLNRIKKTGQAKDSISHGLVKKFGGIANFINFKNKYSNSNLSELVLKRKTLETYTVYNNKLIRLREPIYQVPNSKYGRAHFLSSTKNIGKYEIGTLLFNFLIIWLMAIILYVSLIAVFYLRL